jgi:putative two-component system response regulator
MLAAPLERLAVTVVDEDAAARAELVRAAESWGYTCQAASTAEEGVALLKERPTAVTVTDLRLPGRSGAWLVREVQRRWPDAAVIVVTASRDVESLAQCMDAGVDHYFLKPVNLDEFHHALGATFRQHHRHDECARYRRYLERNLNRQTRKLRRTFASATDSMVRLLEARDPYTSGHSLRVSALTMRLADKLALNERARQRLSLAARLHDIGKVGLPESILNKPDRLTADEFKLVRKHPAMGARILAPLIRNTGVRTAIRSHHERFDGLGYPDKLRGGNIPLLARVIAVVDAFDAMTSDRAYRPALSQEEAITRLIDGAGTQFDPELVPPFVSLIQKD